MRGNGGAPPFGGWNGTLVLPPNTGTFLKWGLAVIGLVFFLVALNILRTIYTDWLWFNHLGFLNVFTTILWTRIWLFLTGFAVFGVLITASVVMVRRHSRGESALPLPPETLRLLNRLLGVVTILGAILLSIIFGAMAASRWEL
ncbi:MAG: UPF0182 family protein, partial [Dehalococcoidia bacterium]